MMKDQTKSYPSEQEAFKQIMSVIEYGATFQWPTVCDWMGFDVSVVELPRTWEFNQPWMKLVKLLEHEGYFLTERGMNGKGFRILERTEMAEYVKNKELRAANQSLENSLCLSKVPRDGLNDSDLKKLDHWEEKSALVGATAKVLLRKRNLPSPEMTIKSIKQMQ